MTIDLLTILFLTRRIGFCLFFFEEREKVLISVVVGRGLSYKDPYLRLLSQVMREFH